MFSLYKMYFLDIIGQFKSDYRIYLWDIYNEPGNSGHVANSIPLLKLAFQWARQANPSQPISAGVWNWDVSYSELNDIQLTNSDVVTFHKYANEADTNNTIE